jgi:hypothetical protein
MTDLRKYAAGQHCVRCGACDGTVVLCHYFGARRHNYGGGMGRKGHDAVAAHLCSACHSHMDTASRDKEGRWLHSEEFLHLCAMTWMRIADDLLTRNHE